MKGIPYTLYNYCFCVTKCKLLFLFLLQGMDSSIPRDTSFTNLLEDSYDENMSGSSHISGEDSVPQARAFSQTSPPQVESTAKKLRGNNFSIEEDVLLVSAFLKVNQDVVQSTNQKHTTYWSRIWEYYHQWKTFTF